MRIANAPLSYGAFELTVGVHPNVPGPEELLAEIASAGYDGTELRTKDGLTIQGLLIKQSDPLMMRSMGGITQIIPADRLAPQPQGRRRMQESLMMSAAQLGLTAQDVADLVAFLRSN